MFCQTLDALDSNTRERFRGENVSLNLKFLAALKKATYFVKLTKNHFL